MNEADYLRERARSCLEAARSTALPHAIRQLEAQAAEFRRQAAVLEARLAALK